MPESYKSQLRLYRWGHPSLALNTSLESSNTLPVFTGGWLRCQNRYGKKLIDIYFQSGRYLRSDLSQEQKFLLEVTISYFLMHEYGKDFDIRFFEYDVTNMQDFLSGRIPCRAIKYNSYTSDFISFLEYNRYDSLAELYKAKDTYHEIKNPTAESEIQAKYHPMYY